ncbi:BTB/POZ domain-containing protein 19 [Pyxicephalus adspersus]|uniref:BTB/POZ domain-containing protein 19 n=1 Tax=Pyxicephalus adspersus TaxID=30357 RepID=UPI003B5CFAF7
MAQAPALPSAPATLGGKSSGLPSALRGLINNAQFSDVSFVVGKERQVIHAHRCILACRCPVFQRMFSHQLQAERSPQELQVPFVLADTTPSVFLAVIEFIYTNSVTLTCDIALEVLTSAVEYGLDELRKLCVDFIGQSLSVELACEAFQAAVTYGQTDLRQRCLAFIERHTQEIVRTQSFRELSDLGIVSILQSDRLTLDEVPLIRAVREWAHVSSVVLDMPVAEVAQDAVRELRLFLLSPEELTTLERENAKDELIPEIQIAQSWKFHALKKVIDSEPHIFRRRRGTLPRDHHRYLDPPPK